MLLSNLLYTQTVLVIGSCLIMSLVLLTNLVCYIGYITPQHVLAKPAKLGKNSRSLVVMAYIVAYFLAIFRLPYSVIPYVSQLLSYLLLRRRFRGLWDSYLFQLARMGGDLVNLIVTTILLAGILNSQNEAVTYGLISLATWAEIVRLTTEKGQTFFSALWQIIPHNAIARQIENGAAPPSRRLARYVGYYTLNDTEKISYINCLIQEIIAVDSQTAVKLAYFRALQIVSYTVGLRAGQVRDVAGGAIFVHPLWLNDPWLLIGLVFRRTPWMFDPRFLPRPFFYRTQANRLATFFVLQNARFSPPFALYQFGHEIKAARFDLFYRLCRWLNLDLEEPVGEDGAYRFNRIIEYLSAGRERAGVEPGQRPLWTDDEAIADVVAGSKKGSLPTAAEIARRYTYPLKYIEEVLYPKIIFAASRIPAEPGSPLEPALPNEDNAPHRPA
jgi:hypothetical protein